MRRLMRWLTMKRLLQLASLVLTGLTVWIGIRWAMQGLRPAIECGVLDALRRLDWAAVFACFDQADYEALREFVGLMSSAVASVLAWMASRQAPDTPIGEYDPKPEEHKSDRNAMVDRVWNNWIEGYLDQVLYKTVLMSLGITWQPAATPRLGDVRLRRRGEPERPVPEHVAAVQLFDEAGHTLLILGEPGSGKTTMMLDLARSLLERARNEDIRIPVVFNLSSFTEPEQTLDDWLVSEFRSRYQVDEKFVRYWLAHNELTLLLDGLDEVRADRRAGVVEKIDQYRLQRMTPWLVVCCRQNEYDELVADGSALEAVDAVVLQPLTTGQIRRYLVQELKGPEPQRLWRALQDDPVLMELADTPLMLNVMLLAAEQLDWSALPSNWGVKAVRHHIYDAYIRSMLARPRNTGGRYPDGKTLQWLPWLALEMFIHGQTVFVLERMKGRWLNRPWQRFCWMLIRGLTGGLTVGLIVGLIVGLLYGQIGGQIAVVIYMPIIGLIVGLIGGLLYGLIVGLLYGLIGGLTFVSSGMLIGQPTAFESSYKATRPDAAIRQSIRSGLLYGLSAGLVFGLLYAMSVGLLLGLLYGLSAGLAFGVAFGWQTVIQHSTLRLFLFLDGSMPFRYVRFLDYCVDRALLRRVVGGYMFIHRTMMEHFVYLDLEKWKERTG